MAAAAAEGRLKAWAMSSRGDIRRLHVQRIKLAARQVFHHIGGRVLILFMEILLHKFESFVIVRPCGSQNRRNLRMDDNEHIVHQGRRG